MTKFKRGLVLSISLVLCVCFSFYAYVEINLRDIDERAKPITREVLTQYHLTKVSGHSFEEVLLDQKEPLNALPLEARLDFFTKILTHCYLYTVNALTFQNLFLEDAEELYEHMTAYKNQDYFRKLNNRERGNFLYWYELLPTIIDNQKRKT
ncbi:MAG: hypothetical protein JAZ18_01815 [Candidatus Thiodiazotropha endolucinida]|nr:hypothetical protein [Candidatus Thiodiazotropha endolucinida]